jgi:hypothetical protein
VNVLLAFIASRTQDTPDGAPSSLGVYEYGGGTKFGIEWVSGDSAAQTELFRDDVLYSTIGAGVMSYDVGLKSGDGSHTWKARHRKGGVSAFSASISTVEGSEAA